MALNCMPGSAQSFLCVLTYLILQLAYKVDTIILLFTNGEIEGARS